ncbi:hypothetical protein [Micromonospora sp. CPCC 205561]|uniref:hypothetical protein n=1 Tax=Micromonospora sp. CPCC 205561 TaxID=3122407 RepID=UPI002FF01FF1
MATWSSLNLREAQGSFRLDAEFWQPDFVQNEAMLRGMKCRRLDEICRDVRKGIFYILAEDYVSDGVPFYRSANVGDILPKENDLVFISEERDAADWKTSLGRGDVVLAKTARIAASLVMRDRINISQDVIGLRVDKEAVNPAYLTVFLSSAPGLLQMRRWFQGQVQGHLSLPDVRGMLIPIISNGAQELIEGHVHSAARLRSSAESTLEEASSVLAEGIGISHLRPGLRPTYGVQLSELSAAGRMDAEYFQPHLRELVERLGRDGTTVADFAVPAKNKFLSEAHGDTFRYIEIGGVRRDGLVDAEEIVVDDAPSRARWIVRAGDVVTSTVRPKRRLTAVVSQSQNGFICSSGFSVLRPRGVPSEVLLTFLRLPLVCELLDLMTTASMYPALRPDDFLKLPMPRVAEDLSARIAGLVRDGWNLLKEADGELAAARGVLAQELG